ncbi:MAG TPA: hypothetical protein PLX66_00530 [Bacilli bacterium]|nr:hypothetical protein [Bacilli bacterium]
MIEEINYMERYDNLLCIQPNYGVDRIKEPVSFDRIGLEIEIAVNYERERYTFIRTLLKKIKKAVGNNGYFTSDGTILGNYSFEIVLDPLPIKEIKKIYSTLLKIIKFSDGSIMIDKEHNCGIHMNFNQYDVTDLDTSHQKLLLLMKDKKEYFEENVYKQIIYNFNFEDYKKFQKTVSAKYTAVNYLNKKLIEVRNIKVGLSASEIEKVMELLLGTIFYDKTLIKKEKKFATDMTKIMSRVWQKNNYQDIEKAIVNDKLMVINFTKNGPKIVLVDEKLKKEILEMDKN